MMKRILMAGAMLSAVVLGPAGAAQAQLGTASDLASCQTIDTILTGLKKDIDKEFEYLKSYSGQKLPVSAYNKRLYRNDGRVVMFKELLADYKSKCTGRSYQSTALSEVCSNPGVMRKYVYDASGCVNYRNGR